MGVEHALVCRKCKQFIDLHKCYELSMLLGRVTPPSGAKGDYRDSIGGDAYLRGGYWESRGVWFLWQHREHPGVEMINDCSDEYYDDVGKLQEVFSHEDDLKLRKEKPNP